MSIESVMSEIKSLRLQLEVLEAECKALRNAEAKPFSSLQGLLRDEGPFTEEEIDAALYRCPDPDEW